MHNGICQRQVALRRAQAPVAQKPLHCRDRRPDLDQLAGEGVPQLVARHAQAELASIPGDLELDAGKAMGRPKRLVKTTS